MDAIVIYCRDCGALFYAASRPEPADILEIVDYAKQGHQVAKVDAAVVRAEFCTCRCKDAVPN